MRERERKKGRMGNRERDRKRKASKATLNENWTTKMKKISKIFGQLGQLM